LIQRVDDREETVRRRLEIYENQTSPLKQYYADWADSNAEGSPRYIRVDGIGNVEDISKKIVAGIEQGDAAAAARAGAAKSG